MLVYIDADELKLLIHELKRAIKQSAASGAPTFFCVDCRRVIDIENEYYEHSFHTVTYKDEWIDGLSEWVKALEWILYVKGKMV